MDSLGEESGQDVVELVEAVVLGPRLSLVVVAVAADNAGIGWGVGMG